MKSEITNGINNSGIPEVTKIEFSYSRFLTCLDNEIKTGLSMGQHYPQAR